MTNRTLKHEWLQLIPRGDAVELIFEQIGRKPEETKRQVKNRVNTAIMRAVQAGELIQLDRSSSQKPEYFLESRRFFTWAKSRYPEVAKLCGIPLDPENVVLQSAAVAASAGGMVCVILPSDYDELKKLFIDAKVDNDRLTKENAKLRRENSALRERKDKSKRAERQLDRRNSEQLKPELVWKR